MGGQKSGTAATDGIMKRSPLLVGVLIVQLLLGLSLVALSIYVLTLTRSPDILKESDAADAVQGLLIGAGVLGGPGLLCLVAVWGLWKRRNWGWWLGVLCDVGMVGVLCYSMVDDGWHNIDWDMGMFNAAFIVSSVCLLLPSVRKFYWGVREAAPNPSG